MVQRGINQIMNYEKFSLKNLAHLILISLLIISKYTNSLNCSSDFKQTSSIVTMPSKNSVNRPKLTVNLNKRSQQLGLKRAQRERAGLLQPARSSVNSKSGEIKSVALDLYFQDKDNVEPMSKVTTKTLSKKRAKKIERNIKYAEQRKLLTDVQAKLENNDMEVDSKKHDKKIVKEQSSLTKVKNALWNILEDKASQGLVLGSGQGTTLGGAFFP